MVWKQTGKDEWHNFVNKNSRKFHDGIFLVKTNAGYWLFDSFYGRAKSKIFKTRILALNYARKYMKNVK